jgi:hypothetical protein
MRDNPDIDQLKRQASELLEAYRAQSPDAIIEVTSDHRTAAPETFALHDAQFVLARWTRFVGVRTHCSAGCGGSMHWVEPHSDAGQ